ncbi:MAG: hypothetical protein Q4D04_02775, partial [Clostridia bacterium]|nr:hypothetical protein [Clostridia bacterium]
MIVAATQRAIAARKCMLYMTVRDKTKLLARSRGLLAVEGVSFESVHYKVLKATMSLFDIKMERNYPFDEATEDLLAGYAPIFDITAEFAACDGEIIPAVIRDLTPERHSGWGSARGRLVFGASPPGYV